MDLKESWSDHEMSNELNREFHERYNKAINNPTRRKILSLLLDEGGWMARGEIAESLDMDMSDLRYHLDFLEWGFCVEKNEDQYRITQEGLVVEKIRERER